ncbi:TPA: hypothetical protein ACJMFY_000595 [Neisseria meningitidis]
MAGWNVSVGMGFMMFGLWVRLAASGKTEPAKRSACRFGLFSFAMPYSSCESIGYAAQLVVV